MNYKFLLIAFTSLTLFATACSSSKDLSENNSGKTQSELDKNPIYTLSQGGCYGECPIYTFELYPDGRATLDKKKHLPSPGKYEMKLDDATTMSIIRDLDKAKFMKLEDEYESQVPDLSLTTMTYVKTGITKTVKGKETLPESLRAIQDKVEMIMKAPGWKVVEIYEEEEDEMKGKELILTELLIQPNDGIALSRWMRRYKEEGLRLIERVDQENNIWLFSWNTNKVAPRKFISIIQKDPDIKSVEFNSKEIEIE